MLHGRGVIRTHSNTTAQAFAESFFELTDLWCETTEPDEYCGFLTNLLAAVATGRVHVTPTELLHRAHKIKQN